MKQVQGILVAGAIGLIAPFLGELCLFVAWPGNGVGINLPLEWFCVVVAGIAAALVSDLVVERGHDGIGGVLAMATATYLIAILLFPIFFPAPLLPGGSSLDTSGDYYGAMPLVVMFTLPAWVGLLVPSAVWVGVVNRLGRTPRAVSWGRNMAGPQADHQARRRPRLSVRVAVAACGAETQGTTANGPARSVS